MILKAEKLQHNIRIREDLRKALLEEKKKKYSALWHYRRSADSQPGYALEQHH